MPRIFRYLEGNEKYIHNIDAAADRKESKKEMKSYQHSNKSESLKGVAGLNCESRFFGFFFLSRFRPPSFIFLPSLTYPMDGWMHRKCMYAYTYTYGTTLTAHLSLSEDVDIVV